MKHCRVGKSDTIVFSPPFTPPTGATENPLTVEAARESRRRKERSLFILYG